MCGVCVTILLYIILYLILYYTLPILPILFSSSHLFLLLLFLPFLILLPLRILLSSSDLSPTYLIQSIRVGTLIRLFIFQTIRPRMFYRSGWLRCDVFTYVVFVLMFWAGGMVEVCRWWLVCVGLYYIILLYIYIYYYIIYYTYIIISIIILYLILYSSSLLFFSPLPLLSSQSIFYPFLSSSFPFLLSSPLPSPTHLPFPIQQSSQSLTPHVLSDGNVEWCSLYLYRVMFMFRADVDVWCYIILYYYRYIIIILYLILYSSFFWSILLPLLFHSFLFLFLSLLLS